MRFLSFFKKKQLRKQKQSSYNNCYEDPDVSSADSIVGRVDICYASSDTPFTDAIEKEIQSPEEVNFLDNYKMVRNELKEARSFEYELKQQLYDIEDNLRKKKLDINEDKFHKELQDIIDVASAKIREVENNLFEMRSSPIYEELVSRAGKRARAEMIQRYKDMYSGKMD